MRLLASFLLLATCFNYSYQICHNNICDTDKCTANAQCPAGYECDAVCGYCNPIPNYCSSNNMCDGYDEMCDVANDPYTTCFWCDLSDNTCKPGCNSNANCDDGYQCNNHLCVENTSCPDDAYCNEGLIGTCDIESSPYTQCMYCEGGECLPGCLADANCPHGYTCTSHKCEGQPGNTLIDSITIKTESCTGCTDEGVTVQLQGEKVPGFPNGIPCSTNELDRAGTEEFGAGGSARFDGKLNGSQNDEEETMMGGCFRAPLNRQLNDGALKWQGDGTWSPSKVCVDWIPQGEKFANECDLTTVEGEPDKFRLTNCHDIAPKTKCE